MVSRVPEIDVRSVAEKQRSGEQFVILDVREPYEYRLARLQDERVMYAPLSQLGYLGPQALPAEAQDRLAEIVVVCHHGMRSADVTAWLRQMGWENVTSMAGGLDAYARLIDPSVGLY